MDFRVWTVGSGKNIKGGLMKVWNELFEELPRNKGTYTIASFRTLKEARELRESVIKNSYIPNIDRILHIDKWIGLKNPKLLKSYD
jgi:hypothetical protein